MRFLTIKEVAALLKLAEKTVYAMAQAGELYECRPGAANRPLGGRSRHRGIQATVLHRVVREHLATLVQQCAEAAPWMQSHPIPADRSAWDPYYGIW
jgi:excisionase family DNA binding protein